MNNVSSNNVGSLPRIRMVSVDDVCDQLNNRLTSTTCHLDQFTGTRIEKQNVERWLDDYVDLATAMDWSPAARCRKFALYLGGNAKDWYRTDVADSTSLRDNWDNLRTAFLDEFLPTDLESYRRRLLIRRQQNESEDVSDYIRSKKRLCYDVDSAMDEAEKVRYIIEGLQPDILEKVELFRNLITDVHRLKLHAVQAETAIRLRTVHDSERDKSRPLPCFDGRRGRTDIVMYTRSSSTGKRNHQADFDEYQCRFDKFQKKDLSYCKDEHEELKVTCYYCYQKGHMQRECDYRIEDQKKGVFLNKRTDGKRSRHNQLSDTSHRH